MKGRGKGGKRQGAGAPCKEVHKKSKVVRVPMDVHGAVMDLISKHNAMITNVDALKMNAAKLKPISKHKVNKVDDTTKQSIYQYKCGCILDNTIFRRCNTCSIERSKHV